jgi:hypothetical protein
VHIRRPGSLARAPRLPSPRATRYRLGVRAAPRAKTFRSKAPRALAAGLGCVGLACAGISPAEHQRAVADAERQAEHGRRRADAQRADEAAARRAAEEGLALCRREAAAQLARISLAPDLGRRAIERWSAAEAVRAGRATPALVRAVEARVAERGPEERVVVRIGPGLARTTFVPVWALVEPVGGRLLVDAARGETVEIALERGP